MGALLITLIYNLIVWIKYKVVPVSISETSYIFGGNKRYFFTLYCIIMTFILTPQLLSILPEKYGFISFLMCTGFAFAGVSPLFKSGMDKIVHYMSAAISFVAFIIIMILFMNWWYVVAFIVPYIGLLIWKRECYVYFAEMLAIIEIWYFIVFN